MNYENRFAAIFKLLLYGKQVLIAKVIKRVFKAFVINTIY